MGGKLPVKTDRRSTSVSFYLTVTVTVLVYEPHLTVSFAVPAFTPFMVMTLTSVPVTFTTDEFELVPVMTAVA